MSALESLTWTLREAVEQSVQPAVRTYKRGRLRIAGGDNSDAAMRELVAARDAAKQAALNFTDAVQRVSKAMASMGAETAALKPGEGTPGSV